MKHLLDLVTAATPLLIGMVTVTPPQVQYAPAASPISWKEVEAKPNNAKKFSADRDILGDSKPPVSVKLVEMSDERPYGESGRRIVWVARYEGVTVHRDSNHATSVTLSLAFDATTNNLVCAFTDPAPQWARSAEDPGDIESTMGWEAHPLSTTLCGQP